MTVNYVSEVSNFRREHIWFEVRYVTQIFAMVANSYQYRLICGESYMDVYTRTLSFYMRIKHMLLYISSVYIMLEVSKSDTLRPYLVDDV